MQGLRTGCTSFEQLGTKSKNIDRHTPSGLDIKSLSPAGMGQRSQISIREEQTRLRPVDKGCHAASAGARVGQQKRTMSQRQTSIPKRRVDWLFAGAA